MYESSLIKRIYWEKNKDSDQSDTETKEDETHDHEHDHDHEHGHDHDHMRGLQKTEVLTDLDETQQRKKLIKEEIKSKKPFLYRFSNYWAYVCKCCRKQQSKRLLKYREDMYNSAKTKLYDEMDLHKMIKLSRIGAFAYKLVLKKYHK